MTLTLKIASQFFCMTHRLRTMHHHIRFGYKKLSCSEDIFWTKQAGRYTKRRTTRTRRFHYTPFPPLPPPPPPNPQPCICTWGITKPERGLKQRFTCFGMKSVKVLPISKHCTDSILHYFVGRAEYLRIPDKVSIFDFGRPQKSIQSTQFLEKTFSDSFYLKMPQGV